MSSIDLKTTQRTKLLELGLISKPSASGYDRYFDPQTGATYTFSPRGYVLRKSAAGTYQVNPRFKVKGLGSKRVQATVRFNDPSAVTALAIKAVTNFRTYNGL